MSKTSDDSLLAHGEALLIIDDVIVRTMYHGDYV